MERFTAARVAHLATVGAGGQPRLVPITFAVRGNVIVTAVDHKPKRTNDLRRLRDIAANPAVSVLADRYDEDWSLLWWVRADGTARILREEDRAEPVRWLVEKYDQYTGRPPGGPVIWIDVTTWRAWSATSGRFPG